MKNKLIDEILKFDTLSNRKNLFGGNIDLAEDLLEVVDSYVENGNFPEKKEVIYGLRVAGEFSLFDFDVVSQISRIALRYNQKVSAVDHINRINFYKNSLSKPELVDTLYLKNVQYWSK